MLVFSTAVAFVATFALRLTWIALRRYPRNIEEGKDRLILGAIFDASLYFLAFALAVQVLIG